MAGRHKATVQSVVLTRRLTGLRLWFDGALAREHAPEAIQPHVSTHRTNTTSHKAQASIHTPQYAYPKLTNAPHAKTTGHTPHPHTTSHANRPDRALPNTTNHNNHNQS